MRESGDPSLGQAVKQMGTDCQARSQHPLALIVIGSGLETVHGVTETSPQCLKDSCGTGNRPGRARPLCLKERAGAGGGWAQLG